MSGSVRDRSTVDPLLAIDPQLRQGAQAMRETYARFTPLDISKLGERRAWMASLRQDAQSVVLSH